ncbi:MAG: LamG-like jellyroll fold domain-containing protein, partial [Planctomycetota bacterium]
MARISFALCTLAVTAAVSLSAGDVKGPEASPPTGPQTEQPADDGASTVRQSSPQTQPADAASARAKRVTRTFVTAAGRKMVVYDRQRLAFFDGLGADARKVAEVDCKDQGVIASKQGKFVVICPRYIGAEGKVKIYDSSGVEVGEFEVKRPWMVRAVSDQGPLVSLRPVYPGTSPAWARLCDKTGRVIFSFEQKEGGGVFLDFTRDGSPVLWGYRKGIPNCISLLDQAGKEVRTHTYGREIRIARVDLHTASGLIPLMLEATDIHTDRLDVWNTKDGTIQTILSGQKPGVLSPGATAVSPNGQYLAVRKRRTGLMVLDLRSGDVLADRDIKKTDEEFGSIAEMLASDQGNVTVVTWAGRVHVFTKTGRQLSAVALPDVGRLVPLADGSIAAVGRDYVQIIRQDEGVQKQPVEAGNTAWGKAADGVQAGIAIVDPPPNRTVRIGQKLRLKLFLRNLTKEPIGILIYEGIPSSWQPSLTDGQVRLPGSLSIPGPWPVRKVLLPAGEVVLVADVRCLIVDPAWRGKRTAEDCLLRLKPSKYRICYCPLFPRQVRGTDERQWQGKTGDLLSGELGLKVLPAAQPAKETPRHADEGPAAPEDPAVPGWPAPAPADAAAQAGAATGGAEEEFSTYNAGEVSNKPKRPATWVAKGPVLVTYISTYHWNNGRGAAPGKISLRHADGTAYGPWPAAGEDGPGGLKNAIWAVRPEVVVKPGTYTVVDSDPATWGRNEASEQKGFIRIRFLRLPGTSQPALARGLVALWLGEGDANDSAGQNHGELKGGVTFADGKSGRAFHFDGKGGHLAVPFRPALDLDREFTLSAWIKPTDRQGAGGPELRFIVSRWIYGGTGDYYLALYSSGCVKLGVAHGPSEGLEGKSVLPKGKWSHVAGTFNNGQMKVFVNGKLDGARVSTKIRRTTQGPFEHGEVYLGALWDKSFSFDGDVDEVAVWNRALSGDEIRAMFAGGLQAVNPLANGLAALWCGDGDASDSASQNHGALKNGAKFAPGKFGQAFKLDGIDDHVDCGSPKELRITGSQTIALWIRPSRLGFQQSLLAKACGGEGTIRLMAGGEVEYSYGTSGDPVHSPYCYIGTYGRA